MAVRKSSAEKRHRQSEDRRIRNKTVKSTVRTYAKKVTLAVQKKDMTGAKEELANLIKNLDTAARKGIIKKNTASRKKSRMTKLFNTLKA